MVSLDLDNIADGWASEATFQTEQVYMIRALGGSLIVPFVDPRGTGSAGEVARADSAGSWAVTNNLTPAPVHVWDTAITADGWWLFGSSDESSPAGAAVIWRSVDNGGSWVVSLSVDSGGEWNESIDAGNRFYGVQQYPDGTMVATCLGAAEPEARAYLWEPGGSAWVDITDEQAASIANRAQVGFSYNGTPFFLALGNSIVSVRPVDSATRSTIQGLVPVLLDAFDTENYLYGLGYDGKVWRATPDGEWTVLRTLTEPTLRSLAVDEVKGRIFLGTTDGRVLTCWLP